MERNIWTGSSKIFSRQWNNRQTTCVKTPQQGYKNGRVPEKED